jgi:hypothetical protein
MLTNHLHLAPWLGMSGTVPLAPTVCLYVMKRDNFTSTFYYLPILMYETETWTSRKMYSVARLHTLGMKFIEHIKK